MDARARKETIRRLTLVRRARLDPAERHRAAADAAELLFALPDIADAHSLMAFVSTRTEISTEPLIVRALAEGRSIFVPYVEAPGVMRAAPLRSLDELRPGFGGIPEPAAREPVDAGIVEAVIVPGVAFDQRGRRLGYGGGFYDRFLSGMPRDTPRIGLAFEIQVVDEVPEEPGDERVHLLVTEAAVRDCRRS